MRIATGPACAERRAKIMQLIREKARSAKELAHLLHLEPVTVRAHLGALRTAGRIHISDRDGNVKIFAYGPGNDAPDLRGQILIVLQGTQKFTSRNNHTRIVSTRMTIQQLHEALGTEGGDVRRMVNELKAAGKLYVADWQKRCHTWTPMYSAGNKPDKPRPAPLSKTELRRRSWAAIKADPERFMRYKAQEAARSFRRGRVKTKADPFLAQFAGIFGKPKQEAA